MPYDDLGTDRIDNRDGLDRTFSYLTHESRGYPATMFGIFRRKKDDNKDVHIAAERTETPMSGPMTLMVSQEMPLLDSSSRARVYEILRNYDGPTITSQEEMPQELREILDL